MNQKTYNHTPFPQLNLIQEKSRKMELFHNKSPRFNNSLEDYSEEPYMQHITSELLSESPQNDSKQDWNEESQLLCIIQIDISENQQDQIQIYSDSDPSNLAHSFAQKHGLPPNTMYKLMKHLNESKNKAIEQIREQQQQINNSNHYKSNLKEEMEQILSEMHQERKPENPKVIGKTPNLSQASLKLGYYHEDQELTFTPRINEYSQQLFQEKFEKPRPVFDRLYNHACARQKLSNNIQQIWKKESEQLQKNTFHPEVNLKSRVIMDQFGERSFEPVEERLIKMEQVKASHLKYLRKLQLEKENQFSFQPTLNQKLSAGDQPTRSIEIVQQCQPKEHSHSPVLHTANRQAQRTSRNSQNNQSSFFEGEYRFHPQLNENSIERVRQSGLSFEQRQHIFQQKKESMKLAQERPKPKQSKKSKSSLHRKPVWEHLYNERQRIDKCRENKLQEIIKKFKQQNPVPCPNSDLILNNCVEAVVHKLFDLLDYDQDGLISSISIHLKGIPPIALKVIQEALIKMDEEGATLDRKNFSQSILRNGRMVRQLFEMRDKI